jgi:hypothetical protein
MRQCRLRRPPILIGFKLLDGAREVQQPRDREEYLT